MKLEQVSAASTKELVSFYNKNCECFGKKQVSKFSDRMTAEIRVKTMIEDIEAAEAEAQNEVAPSTLSICLGLSPKPFEEVNMEVRKEHAEAVHADYEARHFEMPEHCPSCGIHLSNGIGCHDQEVNGKKIKHDKFEYVCLACNEEFGPAIRKGKSSNPTGEVREAMKTSLKLDRTITAYDAEMVQIGVWKNAFQMWKEHTDWMTSAQQDSLTAKLYKAAKQGEKISVVINNRTFELVNV